MIGFAVVMRADSVGPIHKEEFATYDEAKARFQSVKGRWTFCKLMLILEEN